MSNYHQKSIAYCFGLMAFAVTGTSRADEFTKADLQRYQQQFMATVAEGRELWTSPKLGANGALNRAARP